MSQLRKNPVWAAGLLLVALQAVHTYASAEALLSKPILSWIQLGIVVLTAVLTYAVNRVTTPYSAPTTKEGEPAVVLSTDEVKRVELPPTARREPGVPYDPYAGEHFPRSTRL